MMVMTYLTLCFSGFGIIAFLGIMLVFWANFLKVNEKENEYEFRSVKE